MASKKGNWWDCYEQEDDNEEVLPMRPALSPAHLFAPA